MRRSLRDTFRREALSPSFLRQAFTSRLETVVGGTLGPDGGVTLGEGVGSFGSESILIGVPLGGGAVGTGVGSTVGLTLGV